jgi:hypothetical protein
LKAWGVSLAKTVSGVYDYAKPGQDPVRLQRPAFLADERTNGRWRVMNGCRDSPRGPRSGRGGKGEDRSRIIAIALL